MGDYCLLSDSPAFNLKAEVREAAKIPKMMVVNVAAGVLDGWSGPWRRLGMLDLQQVTLHRERIA